MPKINPTLIEQYKTLHKKSYGNASVKLLARFLPHIRELGPASIMDYGCGQSTLVDFLKYSPSVKVFRYDPAIAEIAAKPVEKVDLIINTDVLEHIPEEDLNDLLNDIATTAKHAIFSIDMSPSQHLLPDGRNAHITIRQSGWWKDKLSEHFGHVESIRASRPTKCVFKTWHSSWKRAPSRVFEFLFVTALRKLTNKYN